MCSYNEVLLNKFTGLECEISNYSSDLLFEWISKTLFQNYKLKRDSFVKRNLNNRMQCLGR